VVETTGLEKQRPPFSIVEQRRGVRDNFPFVLRFDVFHPLIYFSHIAQDGLILRPNYNRNCNKQNARSCANHSSPILHRLTEK
jgi:hypothetical protein